MHPHGLRILCDGGKVLEQGRGDAVRFCESLNITHLCLLKSREGESGNFISVKNKVYRETAEGRGLWDSPLTLPW